MKEVLFKVGTIVEIENHKEEIENHLIIGLRQYNPNSGRSWDYASVPLPIGYEMNCKAEHPYDNNNIYFFNHTDINKVIDDDIGS